MILLLRALDRLLAVTLLVALAAAGAVVAVFCIGDGTGNLSLHRLSDLVNLPQLRDTVGDWLGRLEADGGVALLGVVAGVGAVALGLLLLAGLLVPRRERLVTLESDGESTITARRRALAAVARALAEQARGVTRAKARVRPRRRRGAKLRVRVDRTRPTPAKEVRDAVRAQLEPVTGSLPLVTRVRTRLGTGSARVE